MIATLLGCTVAVLLTVFNPTAHLGVLPILCYQLLWTVVLTLSASAELNEQKLRMLRS